MRQALAGACVLGLTLWLIAQTRGEPAALPEQVVVPEVITPDQSPELIADDVGSWLLMAEKTKLVFRKAFASGDPSIYWVDPHQGNPELLFECVDPGGMWRITDSVVGVDQGSAGFYLLDVMSGQATDVDGGGGRYRVHLPDGQAEWFVLHRLQGLDPLRQTLFRVDIATGQATQLFEIISTDQYLGFEFTDDGESIEVIEDLQQLRGGLRVHTIEIATGNVMVKETTWSERHSGLARQNVYRINETVNLRRDADRVLWVEQGETRRRLFDTPGADCYIGGPEGGGHVTLFRIVDTTGDGIAAREDGDWIEVWAVDRQTLELTLLADTTDENITRQWTRDGRFFVFNRVVHGPEDTLFRGDLCLYDEPAGELFRIQPSDDELYLHLDASLPDGRLLASAMRSPGESAGGIFAQLWLVDFQSQAPTATVIGGEANGSYAHLQVGQTLLFKAMASRSRAGALYRWTIPPAATRPTTSVEETSD